MIAAGMAASAIVIAIREIYSITVEINDWMDDHILQMQASENLTISSTGRILEAAKTGFGLGYLASVTVIAVGQLLLGNPLAAAGTVASAAVLSNPMAMTCAAVGAIIYGWGALSSKEQKYVLDTISAGLEIGIELIKSIVNFIISTSKEILTKKNRPELENYVRDAASNFGRILWDITGTVKDRVAEAVQTTMVIAQATMEGVIRSSQAAAETTINVTTKSIKAIADQHGDGKRGLDDLAEVGKKTMRRVTRKPRSA